MARTRFIVVVLAIIAAVGLGAAIGSMAGGSKQPIARWTPPAGTPEAQSTSAQAGGIITPTLIATIGNFSTPIPATASPQVTFVMSATPASTATPAAEASSQVATATAAASPRADASPQASPQAATPSLTVTATATVAPIVPTTTIGTLSQLTPTAP